MERVYKFGNANGVARWIYAKLVKEHAPTSDMVTSLAFQNIFGITVHFSEILTTASHKITGPGTAKYNCIYLK